MSLWRLMLPCATAAVMGCATKVDYLLPEGFRGPAMILFDDPLGERVSSIGRRHEEYRLSDDGRLRLRTPFDARLEEQRFFWLSTSGQRIEIPQDGGGDKVRILSYLISSAPRSPTPTHSADAGSITTTAGGFGVVVLVVGRPVDYPDPLAAESTSQDRVMSQEYARLARAGRGK